MEKENLSTVFTIDLNAKTKGRKKLTEEEKAKRIAERERLATLSCSNATVFELIDFLKSKISISVSTLNSSDIIRLNKEIDEISELKEVIKEEQKKVIYKEIERKEKELEELKKSLL